eukprot:SM000122S25791  [mRNA]  locus=s122:392728:394508:+ [translate_table: standard]
MARAEAAPTAAPKAAAAALAVPPDLSSLCSSDDDEWVQTKLKICAKRGRVVRADPDATDSSSDEEFYSPPKTSMLQSPCLKVGGGGGGGEGSDDEGSDKDGSLSFSSIDSTRLHYGQWPPHHHHQQPPPFASSAKSHKKSGGSGGAGKSHHAAVPKAPKKKAKVLRPLDAVVGTNYGPALGGGGGGGGNGVIDGLDLLSPFSVLGSSSDADGGGEEVAQPVKAAAAAAAVLKTRKESKAAKLIAGYYSDTDSVVSDIASDFSDVDGPDCILLDAPPPAVAAAADSLLSDVPLSLLYSSAELELASLMDDIDTCGLPLDNSALWSLYDVPLFNL